MRKKDALTRSQAKEDFDSMKENFRLKRENEELKKEVAFLKKAAAFFAKEIDKRLIDSLTNTIQSLGCAGSCVGWVSVRTLITTTESTGRRIIMPKRLKYRNRFMKFTMSIMEWTATERCRYALSGKDSS